MKPQLSAFPRGESNVARLMRERDWNDSLLGAPDQWPASLRSVVDLMLGSGFPMFVAWGPNLCQLYNDAYVLLLGDKHPGALGCPILDVWPEIRNDIVPLLDQALGGGSPYFENLPLRVQRNDRDRGAGGMLDDAWFTFSYSPVHDERGPVAGVFCVCIETTSSVMAERRASAERARLKNFFEQAPGFSVMLLGPDHVFDSVNRACLQLVGFRDLLGKPVRDAMPEMVAQGFIALLDNVYVRGKPFVGSAMRALFHRVPGDAPSEAYIDFVFQPVFGAEGLVEGIFVQGHDVTEQHNAQRALRDADRQKDEFLATLAHELRNPLAPIRTATLLMASPDASEAAKRRAVDVIARQVRHMGTLLDDLIDVARITQRKLSLKPERLRVRDVVDTAVEAVRPLVDSRLHQLAVDLPDSDLTFSGDAVRITQVLSNLLNNACKYTDPGGHIELAVTHDDETVVFSVTDNGIGLNPETLLGLFDMFAQEQSALDRSQGGLGIGLALTEGLVKLHGGSIAARSRGPGQGSCFTVTLPLGSGDDDMAVEARQAPPIEPTAPRCILLADDNRDALDVLAELLRLEGHDVHVAYDGTQAIAVALTLQPDVMVLDIGMPGSNGYEVASRIRALPWGRVPLLIACTGWGQEDDRQRATAAGFDLHLTKPFDPQTLCSLIAQPRR